MHGVLLTASWCWSLELGPERKQSHIGQHAIVVRVELGVIGLEDRGLSSGNISDKSGHNFLETKEVEVDVASATHLPRLFL